MFKEQGVYVGTMKNLGTENGDGHTTLNTFGEIYCTLATGKIL